MNEGKWKLTACGSRSLLVGVVTRISPSKEKYLTSNIHFDDLSFLCITVEVRKGHVEWSGQMDGLGKPPTVHLLGTGIEIFSSSTGGSRKETELFLPFALPGRRCDPLTPEEIVAPVAKASSSRSWLFISPAGHWGVNGLAGLLGLLHF